MSKRVWPQSISMKLPTLRFRGKVMLGFAVVLAISTVSMGIAYVGFERVSAGVVTYRNSVSEANLARRRGISLHSAMLLCMSRRNQRRLA